MRVSTASSASHKRQRQSLHAAHLYSLRGRGREGEQPGDLVYILSNGDLQPRTTILGGAPSQTTGAVLGLLGVAVVLVRSLHLEIGIEIPAGESGRGATTSAQASHAALAPKRDQSTPLQQLYASQQHPTRLPGSGAGAATTATCAYTRHGSCCHCHTTPDRCGSIDLT